MPQKKPLTNNVPRCASDWASPIIEEAIEKHSRTFLDWPVDEAAKSYARSVGMLMLLAEDRKWKGDDTTQERKPTTKFTDAWHEADEREAEQTLKRKPLTICEELTPISDRLRSTVWMADDKRAAVIDEAKAIIGGLVEALAKIANGEVDWHHKPADEMRDIAEAALDAARSKP